MLRVVRDRFGFLPMLASFLLIHFLTSSFLKSSVILFLKKEGVFDRLGASPAAVLMQTKILPRGRMATTGGSTKSQIVLTPRHGCKCMLDAAVMVEDVLLERMCAK